MTPLLSLAAWQLAWTHDAAPPPRDPSDADDWMLDDIGLARPEIAGALRWPGRVLSRPQAAAEGAGGR